MRKIIICSVLIGLFLLLATGAGTAETEPNDSLEYPDVLQNGITTGELNTDVVNESLFEKDCFRLDLPGDHVNFLIIKKTDTLPHEIHISYYDEDLQPTWMESTLSVAGQRESRVFRPDEGGSVYMVMSGKGEYSIEVQREFVDDPDDQGGEYFPPQPLEDGEVVKGKVFEIERNGTEYVDLDLYSFDMGYNEDLEVKVTRTDGRRGAIELEFYGSPDPAAERERKELEEEGESHTFTQQYDYYSPETMYLSVSGEGNYTIEVSKESDTLEEEEIVIMLVMLMMMVCLPLIGFLVPVIVIIVVIIIVVRKHNEKATKKKRR